MEEKEARKRIILKVAEIKLLSHYKSGFSDKNLVDHFFYKILDENKTVYTVSTSKKLEVDNIIKTSVVDESAEFRGEKQIRLTRVSILDDKTVSKAEFLRLLKDE